MILMGNAILAFGVTAFIAPPWHHHGRHYRHRPGVGPFPVFRHCGSGAGFESADRAAGRRHRAVDGDRVRWP